MNLGRVSQTVYRRSILKQLHTEKEGLLIAPGQEETCWGIRPAPGENVISCEISMYGNEKDLGVFAMARAVNELASRRAENIGVGIQIMLPEFAYESRLKAMIAAAADAAAEQGILIHTADAQAMPMLQTSIVHVTASGTVGPDRMLLSRHALPDQEIVLLNSVGLEGMLRIRREKEAELAGRFTPAFLNQMESYRSEIFSGREMQAAAAIGVSAMHQIADGGILAALWNLAEGAGIGLSVDMRKMTVRQETIEVCEYFHLNPYQLAGTGGVLAVTPRGEELADALTREGMSAAVIGHTTKGRERVIVNGGEVRYLDRPAPDELTKIFAGSEKE